MWLRPFSGLLLLVSSVHAQDLRVGLLGGLGYAYTRAFGETVRGGVAFQGGVALQKPLGKGDIFLGFEPHLALQLLSEKDFGIVERETNLYLRVPALFGYQTSLGGPTLQLQGGLQPGLWIVSQYKYIDKIDGTSISGSNFEDSDLSRFALSLVVSPGLVFNEKIGLYLRGEFMLTSQSSLIGYRNHTIGASLNYFLR